jgi:hypothetical protein
LKRVESITATLAEIEQASDILRSSCSKWHKGEDGKTEGKGNGKRKRPKQNQEERFEKIELMNLIHKM